MRPGATAEISLLLARVALGGQRDTDRSLMRSDGRGADPALRPHFVARAHLLSLHDFDAAALKDGRPAAITVGGDLPSRNDGARQRHGDALRLWAVLERAEDPAISRTLDAMEHHVPSSILVDDRRRRETPARNPARGRMTR